MPSAKWGIACRGMELLRVDDPFLGGVEHHQVYIFGVRDLTEVKHSLGVGITGNRIGVLVEQHGHVGVLVAHERCRTGRHEFDESLIGNVTAVDEHLMAHAIGALEADDAVGGVEEAEFLLFHGVRRVIGSQKIDRAVGYGRNGGLSIGFGAKRRIHLGERAVFQQRFITQCNVVRRGFAGDWQPLGLGFANRIE